MAQGVIADMTKTKCNRLWSLQRDQRRLRNDPSLTEAFAVLISSHIAGCETCKEAHRVD